MHDLTKGPVAVTGGAGLIGSALVWALNLRGITDILIADRLDESEKWKNLVPLAYSDYTDADDLFDRLDGIHTILHLGACSSTTETDAGYLMYNNYQYTKDLAHAALDRGIRFVYASSAATYGALEDHLSDELDIDTLRPLNAYAYSKQRFDQYALRHGLLDRITGIKYFNIFGPNEQHKADMRSLVDKAFHQINESGGIKLFKSHRPDFRDGEQRRDFLYVKDAVEMTLHLAQSGECGLFNVGSGEAHTWLDLVRPIFRAMNVPERIEFIDMPLSLRDKYQYSTQAEIGKLRATGYTARITPLDEAVTDYVGNYLIPGKRLDPAQAPARIGGN